MSIFALNFKFDLQESGGDTLWKDLEQKKTRRMTLKEKNAIRQKQMTQIIMKEEDKLQKQQKR